MTRCKFVCTKAEPSGDSFNYAFDVVTQGSSENENFFKWTPSGQLFLNVVREQQFEVGKEYYLDLTPA